MSGSRGGEGVVLRSCQGGQRWVRLVGWMRGLSQRGRFVRLSYKKGANHTSVRQQSSDHTSLVVIVIAVVVVVVSNIRPSLS